MTVYLVGAGPGDPGLLTRRGAELLEQADVVVYDRLAHPSLLDLAPVTAERINVGKAPGAVEMDQAGINAVLVDRGTAGRTVVRLKGGDPFVFGRGGEEAEALAAAGVAFEVVPGITERDRRAGLRRDPRDPPRPLDARHGRHRARGPGQGHHRHGLGRARPRRGHARDPHGRRPPRRHRGAPRRGRASGRHPGGGGAVGHHAGPTDDPDHARRRSSTRGCARRARSSSGTVAALDLAWFESRPLFGRTVVITRAREQASSLRARLELLGAEVVELPTILVEPVPFELPELDDYGWLVLTSANGVDALFDRGLAPAGLDARALAGLRVAAIGPGTAAALARRGIRADLVPERFVAESLLDAFPTAGRDGHGPARVLLARAEQARDVLPDGIEAKGYAVDVLPVYRTVRARPAPEDLERVRASRVDAITFTSSSTVTGFCDLVGPLAQPRPRVVSIGPITSRTAVERGLHVDIEAEPHSVEGLVDALLAALRDGSSERDEA